RRKLSLQTGLIQGPPAGELAVLPSLARGLCPPLLGSLVPAGDRGWDLQVSVLLQVVAADGVRVAQGEPAVADGGMGQTPSPVGSLKLPFQLVFLRRRGDQRHDAVLVLEIEMAIGVSHCGWSGARTAALFPHQLAGQEFNALGHTVLNV